MDTVLFIMVAVLLMEVSYLIINPRFHLNNMGKQKVFIDTSALMDGRIVTAAQTGFIPDTLVVPKSVIAELQFLADQADNDKRSRARRGLDAIAELKAIKGLRVKIMRDGPLSDGGVDERLIELATKYSGSKLCTIDFNLNKVATAQSIPVLNINELAGNIRMAFLPGETISLHLSQKGQSNNQAVGYLADGTMVVVDNAAKQVGSTVQVEFIRSLQTAAGRMMFAKLLNTTPVSRTKSGTSSSKSSQITTKKPNGRAARASTKAVKSRYSKFPKSQEDSLIDLVNNQE